MAEAKGTFLGRLANLAGAALHQLDICSMDMPRALP